MSVVPVTFHPDDPQVIVNAVTLQQTYQASAIFSVAGYRKISLEVKWSGNQAGQRLSLVPLVSGKAAPAPLATDDEWSAFSINDGSVTPATLGGTLLSGADFTAAPEWGRVTNRALELSHEAIDNATDELRAKYILKLEGERWFHLQYAEIGAGTAGVLTVRMNRFA